MWRMSRAYTEPQFGHMFGTMLMRHVATEHIRPVTAAAHADFAPQTHATRTASSAPPSLAGLVDECLAHDPRARPSFAEVVARLQRIAAVLKSPAAPQSRRQ
mmetsp:Transcript_50239/g.123502  ORF Transcript_50239/g.123502 Transcript_50239/m.123502 type:complete len:102 (-) Transcript_50239:46-351(-)